MLVGELFHGSKSTWWRVRSSVESQKAHRLPSSGNMRRALWWPDVEPLYRRRVTIRFPTVTLRL